ncbi:hypothetical protein BDB00DRAFT_344606 [Zychaea mexicana]|uniref:uncharacterized protein n=1 Tax=Zychaea mexicana TaxID=64656 RepID=UPI0022FDC33B|nr:uncharacterized protein BDB00DRAFT_344606 [Zychaea mexicana]KAI9494058.1 hypothetical protein BDB00DRAFT_344606 [Zychaea mexicana]
MDDETSLPDLANLELDDSDEEFWKMDESSIASHKLPTPPMKPAAFPRIRRHRSGSLSSENSVTSQSTVTYRTHNLMHPSTSNSTATSANGSMTSGSHHYHPPYQQQQHLSPQQQPSSSARLPKPAQSHSFNTSSNNNNNNELPARSGSRIGMTSKLAKRASHIPAPSSSRLATPSPQRTLSTRSSSSIGSGLARLNAANNSSTCSSHARDQQQSSSLLSAAPRTSSRLGNRASHIPSTATSRARSPMGMLGGSSGGGGQRTSIFGGPPSSSSASRPPSRQQQQQQQHVLPRSTASTTRSASRIGMTKRSAY